MNDPLPDRDPIRMDQDRECLRKLLLEGASPPPGPADEAWLKDLPQRIASRVAE